MSANEAVELSENILKKAAEMRKLCEGLDEETASREPAGRWSPKKVLSHLCGPEDGSFAAAIKNVLEKDTPRVDIDPGNPFFTEKRSRMSLADLLSEFEKRYSNLADLVGGLSKEQLARKAHVPAFKEAPMGEYLTLAELLDIIGIMHPESHITHMKEILKEFGKT
jgi:hypothetical protein